MLDIHAEMFFLATRVRAPSRRPVAAYDNRPRHVLPDAAQDRVRFVTPRDLDRTAS